MRDNEASEVRRKTRRKIMSRRSPCKIATNLNAYHYDVSLFLLRNPINSPVILHNKTKWIIVEWTENFYFLPFACSKHSQKAISFLFVVSFFFFFLMKSSKHSWLTIINERKCKKRNDFVQSNMIRNNKSADR